MNWIPTLCLFVGIWTVEAAFGPKKLYSMDLPVTPVSVKVVGKELVIVGPWYIGGISNINWKFRQSSRMKPRIINKDIPNPRSVGMIPNNAFKGSNALTYWVASWGTNETSGAMYVMRPTTTYSVWKDISIDSGWSYERAQWVDMNRDGRTDCLTARFRGGVGQLLWFSQPAGQTLWGQQIIHEGMADGNFVGFVKGKKTYILVAGLEFSTLGLYWSMSRTNLWSASRLVRHRVIDNYGKFYDVQYIDLNRDGRPDVLTTTVNIGNSRGHVLGYEVPDDLQNKIWNRRVLAAGFSGDYSPGKAIAYWPNKWKRKTDRPSIFLSGAGAEILYILSPKPAKTGWGYIKSSVKAGTGMIGIPFIGDIDGDSYPEVFVPQGNKLHVFSYDYNAAVAEPPASKSNAGKVTPRPRPVVSFVPPYYRATTPAPSPLIPKGITPLAALPPFVPRGGPLGGSSPRGSSSSSGSSPNSGGLSGDAASRFGASGILPSSGGSSGGTQNLPPLSGLPSSRNNNNQPRPPAANPPPNGLPPLRPLTGLQGGSSSNNLPSNPPSGGGSSSGGTGNNDVIGLWPVMTNQGPAYVPIRNSNSNNAPSSGTSGTNGQGSSLVQFPWQSGSSPGGNPSGGSTNNGAQNNNPIVPLGGGTGDNTVPDQSDQDPSNNIVPLSNDIDLNSLEPVFEDYTAQPDGSEYYDDVYGQELPSMEVPANLILTITERSYQFREEAADACAFEQKVLCSLQQLESSRSAGPIPLIEWGWFDVEGRAAQIEDCTPGEVKWPGYICHNGVIGHLPVQQSTELKGYCCGVLRGVNITDRKFSNYQDAARGCKQMESHVCSLQEMFDVWQKSSYKSDVWGWYQDDASLIKMVHTCDPDEVLWPGYKCISRRLATSEIVSHVQESAYCCRKSSAIVLYFHFSTLLLLLSISTSFILAN